MPQHRRPANRPAVSLRVKVLSGVGGGLLVAAGLLSAVSAAAANPAAPAQAAAATQIAAPAAPVDAKAAAAQKAAADQAAADENEAARKAAKSAAAFERTSMIGNDMTCQSIGAEAVRISAKTTFDAKLTKVRSSTIITDHRTTFTRPTTAKGALVLSCRGTAVLSTGGTESILVAESVNSYGETYIEYQGL